MLTVDCTPLVSPGFSSFGPQNTMGMALLEPTIVNPGGTLFIVTEDTPAAFRARLAADLATFDLIAVNNHPARLGDGCVPGAGTGLGTTWHSVIGIASGGRVVLTSHDALRFHMIASPLPAFNSIEIVCPGCAPFGARQLIRDAALWAGGGTSTGLLIFNDSPPFVGGSGWTNPELNLPAAWGITDVPAGVGGILGGGYTDILAAHPIYAAVNDVRLVPLSINSFSANIGDDSYHSVFGSFDPQFTVTEVVINSGNPDPGGFGCCSPFDAVTAPNDLAITLIRNQVNTAPVAQCVESVNPSGKNIPPAGSTTLPGSKGGKNDDGFYAISGQDAEDGTADVFVTNASGSATFGPFPSGSVVKLTEAPGKKTPTSKPMGGPNSAVAAHITLDSDAFVFAVDSTGAASPLVSCLVPPPPK